MRKLILLLLFFAFPASAQTPTPEQACGFYSTWAYAVLVKKVPGVPESEVLPALQKEQGPISPQLALAIKDIVTATYSAQLPPITSAADIAYLVSAFNKQCIEDIKQLEETKQLESE